VASIAVTIIATWCTGNRFCRQGHKTDTQLWPKLIQVTSVYRPTFDFGGLAKGELYTLGHLWLRPNYSLQSVCIYCWTFTLVHLWLRPKPKL